jgi:hypothetical protein
MVHLPQILCVIALAVLFQLIVMFSLPGSIEEYFRYYSRSLLGLVVTITIYLTLE